MAPVVDEPGDQAGQHVVGHGEQHEVGIARHIGRRQHGTPGSSASARSRDRSETAETPITS